MSASTLATLLTLLASTHAGALEQGLKRSLAHKAQHADDVELAMLSKEQDADDVELARLSEDLGTDVSDRSADDLVAPWWKQQATDFLDMTRKAAPAPAAAAPPAIVDQTDTYMLCEKMCSSDPEPDYCMTDCHTYVDNGGDVSDLQDFVNDAVHNEKGGKAMEETFETMTGMDVAHCEPEVDIEKVPTFSDVDSNGDGQISWPEAKHYGIKMCIPDEMVYQIFVAADIDTDRAIVLQEWENAGERTEMEQTLDLYLDNLVEGEDEYKRVNLPPFKSFDTNGDGLLDESEIMKVWEFEVYRRIPMLGEKEMAKEMKIIKSRFLPDFYQRIDLDGDGEISAKEYARGETKGASMGFEFVEAAAADEDMPDLDDASNPNPELPPTDFPEPEDSESDSDAPAPAPAPVSSAPSPASPVAPMFLRHRNLDAEAEAEVTEEIAGHVADLERKEHKHHHLRHKHHRHSN